MFCGVLECVFFASKVLLDFTFFFVHGFVCFGGFWVVVVIVVFLGCGCGSYDWFFPRGGSRCTIACIMIVMVVIVTATMTISMAISTGTGCGRPRSMSRLHSIPIPCGKCGTARIQDTMIWILLLLMQGSTLDTFRS